MSTSLADQLSVLWTSPDVPTLDRANKKYVVLSDLHLGNKGRADDFRHNEAIMVDVLEHYEGKGFDLILLGDVEELWQFGSSKIYKKYKDTVYAKIQSFTDERVYRVFGNHDIDWETKGNDPIWQHPAPSQRTVEALKLKDASGEARILLVHGHQGTAESDWLSKISRPLVWFYGRFIEPWIKFDRTPSAPKSRITTDFEKQRYDWAKEQRVIIICGHSHRAIFASKSNLDTLKMEIEERQRKIQGAPSDAAKQALVDEIKVRQQKVLHEQQRGREIESMGKKPLPCYFNAGCGLYEKGLTAIEIDNDTIKLVKWHKESPTSFVPRDYGHGILSAFLKEITEA